MDLLFSNSQLILFTHNMYTSADNFLIGLGAGSRQYCYFPIKGNLGVPTGQKKFDLGGVWTHDLRIRFSDALPTELRGPVREQVGVI